MPNTIIVVPCYNESQRLNRKAFLNFSLEHPEIHFLFVNDGSLDNTADMLQNICQAEPGRFSWVNQPTNGGKAEAVRQGFLTAFGSNPRYIGFWDADLATPLEALSDFVTKLDANSERQCVIGCRIPLLGKQIHRHCWRRWLGRSFAEVASSLLGTRIYDTQCGAKLFRNSPDLRAIFSESFAAKWIFDVEIFARWTRILCRQQRGTLGDVLFELPLENWTEIPGSKVAYSAYFRAIRDLWVIFQRYLRPDRLLPDCSRSVLPPQPGPLGTISAVDLS